MSDAAHTIDVAEAAYNLEAAASEWLPGVLEAGGDLFDLGLGHIGILGGGLRGDQQPAIGQIFTSDGKPDMAMALMTAVQEIGPEIVHERTASALHSPVLEQLSELREEHPKLYEVYTRHLKCKDILTVHAHDPDGHGALVSMPSPALAEVSPSAKRRWELMAVHITTAHRLRRGLGATADSTGFAATDLPLNAEALLDPTRFLVTERAGAAQDNEATQTIREAALRVDKARGSLRKSNPDEALRLWEAMVRGRWSLVDWFDTDGRRFVLARPNTPNLGDPRGLTEREHQAVTYVSHGESQKLVGYRLGLSPQRISYLLKCAMHKLNVKTRAQLIEKLRGMPNDAPELE